MVKKACNTGTAMLARATRPRLLFGVILVDFYFTRCQVGLVDVIKFRPRGLKGQAKVQPKGFWLKPKEGIWKLVILAESRKEPKGNRKIQKKLKEGILQGDLVVRFFGRAISGKPVNLHGL